MAVSYHSQVVEPWGRTPRLPHRVARPQHQDQLPALLAEVAESSGVLAAGLHRSYGDSGLNPEGLMISMCGLDRFIAFDPVSGLLRAEAGVSLDEILRMATPHGWFLPTTPGTRFVTLGGAIANDVHGKNHHRAGSFGRHVRRIGLLRSDAGGLELTAQDHPDLFHATLGGLGLTGLIAWAEIALSPIPSTFVDEETVPFANLDEYFRLSAESDHRFEHVSSWIDCTASGAALGRGVMYRANWSAEGSLEPHSPRQKLKVPIIAPPGLMNSLSLRAFNAAYGGMQRLRRGTARKHYGGAFYPLDAIGGWNRAYGPAGFYQHQFMAPLETQEDAMAEALRTLAAAGQGSFLAVLKSLGPLRSGGLVSFEGPGASLALDFPNRGDATLKLLERLDAIVVAAGGKIYPAKDGRMSAATFRAGYPRWRELEALRDPLFSSRFWRRVTHDE